MSPKVSIIIPTYNSAKFLPRAINSIINQTFQDFELIIVDDGSTDNSKEIITEYTNKDNRIKYYWEPNSGGPAKPKNTNFKYVQGDYIAYLDSDDEWLPKKLEKQLAIFAKFPNQKIGLVSCGANIVNEKGKYLMTINAHNKKRNLSDLLIANYVFSNSGVIIPSAVIKDVGSRDESEDIGYYEDWDMWVRIMARGYIFKFIEEPLINYTIRTNNTSKNIDKLKRAKQNVAFYNKHKQLYKNNDIEYIILARIGLSYAVAGDRTQAKKYYKKSIVIKKTYIVPYIGIILTYLGANASKFATKFWYILRGELGLMRLQKIFDKL